jgi:hypothetical protein
LRHGKNKSSSDEEQKYFSGACFQALGQECYDGLDASSTRTVYKECEYDCASAGFEKSVAEGTSVGNADADVLYEPRRKGSSVGRRRELKKAKGILSKRIEIEKRRGEAA